MRLTTRGRYAVTALLDLALQDQKHDTAVSLSDIAKRQEISISYLEQLFSKLRKKGLVISTRGAAGGYHIAKPLDQISIMNIISAVDESVDARACEGKGNCQDGAMCLTHDLWSGLSEHIEQYLSTVTLNTLINKQNIRNIAERQIMMVEENSQRQNDELRLLDVQVQGKATAPIISNLSKATSKNSSTAQSLTPTQSTIKHKIGENLSA